MQRMLPNWVKNRTSDAKTGLKNALRQSFLLILAASLMIGAVGTVQAKSFWTDDTLTTVSVTELPQQGQKVYALIAQGGPFAHDKDGVVFGNRERLLPQHKRGYYREYTVKTPGLRNRGAKRIVCGGLQAQSPDVCYYTEDHYSSFRKIVSQ